MKQAEFLSGLERELRNQGIHDFAVVPGGKHRRLTFSVRGHLLWIPISSTPSAQNAGIEARADLRRAIRGVMPNDDAKQHVAKIKKRKSLPKVCGNILQNSGPLAPPIPDWRDALVPLRAQMIQDEARDLSVANDIISLARRVVKLRTPWLGTRRIRFQEAA